MCNTIFACWGQMVHVYSLLYDISSFICFLKKQLIIIIKQIAFVPRIDHIVPLTIVLPTTTCF